MTVSYVLTLSGLNGSQYAGTLTLSPAPASAPSSRQPRPGERTWVYVDQLSGSLAVPDLTGPDPVPLSGVSFVGDYGPPVGTHLNGKAGAIQVSLQFNLIDSPGHFIGGSIGYATAGRGAPATPFSMLGTRTD